MSDNLYWNTVKPLLRTILSEMMKCDLFYPFRLVGGTSLSLQLGHRMSDDIDLFTDHEYDSVDFRTIDDFLRGNFYYVSSIPSGPVGLGISYLVGHSENDAVKLDLFYTEKYIQAARQIDIYRLATIEEIIAMKLDIVQRKARKKDFWDIHELMNHYSPTQMIALHKNRYPYGHDEALIRKNFTDFEMADEGFDPICLRGKYWELIKLDIHQAMTSK